MMVYLSLSLSDGSSLRGRLGRGSSLDASLLGRGRSGSLGGGSLGRSGSTFRSNSLLLQESAQLFLGHLGFSLTSRDGFVCSGGFKGLECLFFASFWHFGLVV
jgi:hypothetical protein